MLKKEPCLCNVDYVQNRKENQPEFEKTESSEFRGVFFNHHTNQGKYVETLNLTILLFDLIRSLRSYDDVSASILAVQEELAMNNVSNAFLKECQP
jgi:hypothetical protein